MCGRFTQKRKPSEYASIFKTKLPLIDWSPRYNLSPGQNALVILKTDANEKPEIKTFLWGLIPHWAKERGKYSTINARIETVDTKPAFREPFRHKRCIIPADGYYEWQQLERGMQPWYFHTKNDHPMAFAGLWDTWTDPQGLVIPSFTIIVQPAIGGIKEIHDRMPAHLPEEMWEEWLNTGTTEDLGRIKEILAEGSPENIEWYQVDRMVNSARNEGPELINRI